MSKTHYTRAERRRARQAERRPRGPLLPAVTALFARFDPIMLTYGRASKEYRPEAATVLTRLPQCRSALQVEAVLDEEFLAWFGSAVAPPRSSYQALAHALWNLWEQCGGADA